MNDEEFVNSAIERHFSAGYESYSARLLGPTPSACAILAEILGIEAFPPGSRIASANGPARIFHDFLAGTGPYSILFMVRGPLATAHPIRTRGGDVLFEPAQLPARPAGADEWSVVFATRTKPWGPHWAKLAEAIESGQ